MTIQGSQSLSLTSKCQISPNRIVLDLESEVMRGLGSIPTGGNIFHWIFFCFHVVKSLMPILALLPTLFNYKKNSNSRSTAVFRMRLGT